MMTSSGNQPSRYFQWEIWDVEWHHEDGTSKRRPALLISTSTYNDMHEDLWFVKISSQQHSVPHIVEIATADLAFAQTGLTKTSYFYIADVQTIPRGDVSKRRGSLNQLTAILVNMEIRKATGWSPP